MTDEKQTARGKSLEESVQVMRDQKLWLKILIGMGLGVLTGLLLSPTGAGLLPLVYHSSVAEWLALPGMLFLGLIQMVIIPLIATSIILGIAESGDLTFLQKISARLVPYFLVTTAISITIGVSLVNLIEPGAYIDERLLQGAVNAGTADNRIPEQSFETLTIPQRINNLIPTNLTQAQLDQNMLQIVIASIVLGVATISIASKTAEPFKKLCIAIQTLSMKIVSWAMILAPYAVFGLIASITLKVGLDALTSVGVYALTVLAGLACMLMVYMVIVMFLGRFSPVKFLKGIREVQLLAFSTSSSAATMPFTIQAAEEKLKLRPEITRFTVPLGATINMDGTALYQGVAAIFLCQVYGIDLSMAETLLLIATTVGASIGTPATPGVGLIVLATILTGIGVPAEGIALILGVDRLLDMCRTTVNVTGDLTASTVMQRWIKPKN